ncbi:MAG: hypothetical protein HY319_03795 [Armatimonadetes bacterium]|nr:hypothetical protein [Armatimonadota bacterium]
MRFKRSAKGLALAIVLLLIPIVLVLGLGLATSGIGNLNSADAARYSKMAVFAAEAGISRAIRELTEDSAWSAGFTDIAMVNSATTYSVVVTNNSSGADFVTAPNGARVPPGTIYLLSTGTGRDGAARREVAVLLRPGNDAGPFLPYTGFTEDGIVIDGGQLHTDSFDSRLGDPPSTYADTRVQGDLARGDLGTNFPRTQDQSGSVGVDMRGRQIVIDGSIDVGPLGQPGPPTIAGAGDHPYHGAAVLPDVISLLEAVAPSGTAVALPPFTRGATTLPPGHYDQLDVGGNATVTLTGGTYVVRDVRLTGRLDIENGPVTLYVTHSLVLSGNTVLNDNTQSASDLRILGTDDLSEVRIQGTAGAYMLLHARNARVTIGGTSDLYGAVVSRTLTINGAAALHYDEAIDDLVSGGGSGRPVVISWQRI